MRLFLDTKTRLFYLFKILVTTTTISAPKKSAKRLCLRSCNVKEEEHCSGLVVAHSDNFHKVHHGICRCVEAGPNPSHIRGPWHQNKCSILSGCAAETGDAVRYPCNFWRLLHFFSRTMHRPIGPVRRSRYCSERFRLSLLPICGLPTAPTSTLLTTRCGYDAGPWLSGEGAMCWRSETAFDWRVGQSGARRHRWRDQAVAFTTSCLCPCERGTFRTVFL